METTIPVPKAAQYSKLEALAPQMHYVQVAVTAQLEGTLKFSDAVSQPIVIAILKNPKTEDRQ